MPDPSHPFAYVSEAAEKDADWGATAIADAIISEECRDRELIAEAIHTIIRAAVFEAIGRLAAPID